MYGSVSCSFPFPGSMVHPLQLSPSLSVDPFSLRSSCPVRNVSREADGLGNDAVSGFVVSSLLSSASLSSSDITVKAGTCFIVAI